MEQGVTINKADPYCRPKLTAQNIERFVQMNVGLNSIILLNLPTIFLEILFKFTYYS